MNEYLVSKIKDDIKQISDLEKGDLIQIGNEGYHLFYELSTRDIMRTSTKTAVFYNIRNNQINKITIPKEHIFFHDDKMMYPLGYYNSKPINETDKHYTELIKEFEKLQMI